MVQLFWPPDADPLAHRADTWPYVHSICNYLSLSNDNLYRDLIKRFEEGEVSEGMLASMANNSFLFDRLPEISLLHDDLVLVITMNKLDDAETASTDDEVKDGMGEGNQDQGEAEKSPKSESTVADSSTVGKSAASAKAAKLKRNRTAVGGWEQKMLQEEASEFLTKGKRSTRASTPFGDGSRRKSGSSVNYTE